MVNTCGFTCDMYTQNNDATVVAPFNTILTAACVLSGAFICSTVSNPNLRVPVAAAVGCGDV